MTPPPITMLPARMLNEYAYCPRLFHLEWVQQEWADNVYTLDGKRVHKRVDKAVERASSPDPEAPIVRRSLDIGDERLQLVAKIDLLEPDAEAVVPIDFKRGKIPKTDSQSWEPERVQIGAQALLLRAHGYRVDHGVLYFADSNRRIEIPIDEELERRTLELRDAALAAAARDEAPPPLEDDRKCAGCSLQHICLPEEHALLEGGAPSPKLREVRASAIEAHPLHVTEPGSVIRKDGDELIIESRSGDKSRVRLVDVSSLQIHGSSKVTAPAIHALLGAGITISHLSRGAWLYGRTRGPSHKNVLLRLAQYRAATDPGRCLMLARRFVRAKIKNGRTLLRRNGENVEAALAELDKTLGSLERADSLERLLGLEGQAASVYFRAFAQLLKGRTAEGFDFEWRNRRPAKDPTNAVFSMCYALLTTAWVETVDRVGFDAYLGFYHQPKYGKPALALDLMEEFRPLIADSVVLSVLRRQILKPEDFIRTRSSCVLSKSGRRKLISAFERRMDEQIKHPVFGYRVSYRQVLEIQARLLGRYLTEEIDTYPEMVTR